VEEVELDHLLVNVVVVVVVVADRRIK